MEQNGIEDWAELEGFRILQDFQYLIVNKNLIREIYHKPGFRNLRQLSFDENLINSWKTFDELNTFDSMISEIRCSGNPITTEVDAEIKRAK